MFLAEQSLFLQIKTWFTTVFQDFIADFYLNFIDDNRWIYLVKGLGITLLVAFFAVILGVIIGFLVAIIRVSGDQT